MNKFPLIAALILLTGCSATGQPYSAQKLPARHGSQIVFFRPGGFIGSAINTTIKINGTPKCELPQGSYFVADVSAGQAKIGVQQLSYKVDVKAGERVYMEVDVRGSTVAAQAFGPLGVLAENGGETEYSNFSVHRAYAADAEKILADTKESMSCKG